MIPSDPNLIASAAHERWAAACPSCAQRRVLWPVGQNVSTGREPHAQYVHLTGQKECQ